MICEGDLRKDRGCTMVQDCTGHGSSDCQICGWPVAAHPNTSQHFTKSRIPRPPTRKLARSLHWKGAKR